MATVRTFDTLGYAKFLASKGVEAKVAEALAEANHEFLINDLATKEFVRSELQRETALLENRLVKSLGKLFFASVSLLAIVMPVIYMILQRLLPLAG